VLLRCEIPFDLAVPRSGERQALAWALSDFGRFRERVDWLLLSLRNSIFVSRCGEGVPRWRFAFAGEREMWLLALRDSCVSNPLHRWLAKQLCPHPLVFPQKGIDV
jgi:hypothetical protein